MFIVAMTEITSTLSNLFGGSSDEKKKDTKESEHRDTQTVAGDDGDASKEKESEKEEKKPATDETVKQDSENKEAKTEKQNKTRKRKLKKQGKTDEEATKDDNGDKSAKSEKGKEKKNDEESTQETPSPSVKNATNQTTGITSSNFYLHGSKILNLHFFSYATGRSRSKSKKRDGDDGVKMRTVKVNLTAEVTQLDHNDLTTDLIQKSEAKLEL